jgi:hypothetical protein
MAALGSIPKLDVVGSNPIARYLPIPKYFTFICAKRPPKPAYCRNRISGPKTAIHDVLLRKLTVVSRLVSFPAVTACNKNA